MTPADVLPGVTELLQAARENGYKTALGSASKNAALILERTGLDKWFDVVVDGNSVSHSKPDPEVFQRGAALMKCKPSTCVVFEDAAAGIEAARRGGMRCVGVGSADGLSAADIVLPDLKGFALQKIERLLAG